MPEQAAFGRITHRRHSTFEPARDERNRDLSWEGTGKHQLIYEDKREEQKQAQLRQLVKTCGNAPVELQQLA
jgi:hypothetical protein